MVKRFEDLTAWQKARGLVVEVYRATGEGDFARNFGLRDQIRGSAVSVMANVAEGFERGSVRAFHRFLGIAQGSCGEVRSLLYVALDVGHIPRLRFDSILQPAQEVARIVGALRKSLEPRLRDA
jgi:four helix bundle protein